jgi:hypothetical protein
MNKINMSDLCSYYHLLVVQIFDQYIFFLYLAENLETLKTGEKIHTPTEKEERN